jgi:hypothetical protein
MNKRFTSAIALGLQTVILIIICIENLLPIKLTVLGLTLSTPVAGAILIGAGLAFAMPIYGYLLLNKDQANLKQISQWQAQDAKLAAAVTSDREKQLEAKIATLETALKTALKKQAAG